MAIDRILRWAQIAVAAVCLAVPAVLFGLGVRSAAIDNRPLTPRPAISGTKLLDTTVTDTFDRFLNDGFPLRSKAVEIDADIAAALGDSSNPDVEIGRDGWLFYADARRQPCLDEGEQSRLVDALARTERVITATGRELTMVIAPDKAAIFDTKMSSTPTCALGAADVLAALELPSTLITTWAPTRAVAAADEAAYRRLDTHWTGAGATPTAAALIEELQPGLWDPEAVEVISTGEVEGDLSVLLGRNDSELETLVRSVPSEDRSETEPLAGTVGADSDARVQGVQGTVHRTTWPDAIVGRFVLLHDSFGTRFVPLIAPYFREIATIRAESPRQIDTHAALRDADHIVRLEVQRDFYASLVVEDLAAQFVVAYADEFRQFAVDVSCSDGCAVSASGADSSGAVGDSYVIVRLRDGVSSASISIDGVIHRLVPSAPSAGAVLPAGASLAVDGDVDSVEWAGRLVEI